MRRRRPITPKELQDYTIRWRQHNKAMRRQYCHTAQFDTVEEYISYVRGNIKVASPTRKTIMTRKATHKTTNHPSHSPSIGNCLRKEPPVYSGERQLIGIAVMHKSNLVPIFADEEGDARTEATEISNMSK